MAQDNIEAFNALVLRAVGLLYEAHPRPIDLDPSELMGGAEHGTDEDEEVARGTLLWLYRNGVVSGDYNGEGSPALSNAQLTARALRLLQATEGNLEPPHKLGPVAVSLRSQPGSRDERVTADLLALRLTGR